MKKQYSVISTQRKTAYLQSTNHNQIIYINPVLNSIIEENEGISVTKDESDSVENINKYTPEELKHQYEKYKYLKENHFFDPKSEEVEFTGITEAIVEERLANLRQLTFEVTDACNLRCEYCGYGKFYEDYDCRESKYLDVNAAKKLIDYLVRLWNSTMNTSNDQTIYISFYGGEPLLNMSFIKEVVAYIDSKDLEHHKVQYSMTTNTMLLKKNAQYLVDNNFHLLLSLDGNKKNTSYRVKPNGENSYDDIIKNVDYLKDTYPDFFESNVNFNSVLHDRNSVEDIYSFFNQKYNKKPSIGELNNMGIKDSMKEEFDRTFNDYLGSLYSSKNYDKLEDEMFIKIPTVSTFGIFTSAYTNYFYKSFLDFYIEKNSGKRTPTGTCLPFGKKMFVTVNGKILACERIGHQFALGSVDDKGVNLNYSEIAEKYNSYYDKLKSQCKHCYMQDTCTQCIFNIPTIDDKTVKCDGFMSKLDFEKYLSMEMSLFERKPEFYGKIMREVTIE